MVWVQKFIHLFGGDKDKVAIFGCSAGALNCTFFSLSGLFRSISALNFWNLCRSAAGAASVSVQYVMRRTFEKRLFSAAIAESGAFAQWASKPMHVTEAVYANFAKNLGAENERTPFWSHSH